MTELTDLLQEAKGLEVQSKYADAEVKYSTLIDLAQKTNDDILPAALNGRGITRRMLRKYADAYVDYLAGVAAAENIDLTGVDSPVSMRSARKRQLNSEIALAYVNMADIHRVYHNNATMAHNALNKAEDVIALIGYNSFLVEAKAYDQRGMVYDYMQKGFHNAIDSYLQAKNVCEKLLIDEPENKDYRNRLAQVQLHLGYCYFEKGTENLPKAYAEVVGALDSFKTLGDVAGVVNAVSNLGRFSHVEQDFNATLNYYHQAWNLASEANIGRAVTPIALEMAGAYLSLGRVEEAKPYLERFVNGVQNAEVTESDRTTMKQIFDGVASKYDAAALQVEGFSEVRKLF